MSSQMGREDADLGVLNERVNNFIRECEDDRDDLRKNLEALRQQTHDWMQAMLNRLPPWAVVVGSAMWTLLGAMAMYILTHK